MFCVDTCGVSVRRAQIGWIKKSRFQTQQHPLCGSSEPKCGGQDKLRHGQLGTLTRRSLVFGCAWSGESRVTILIAPSHALNSFPPQIDISLPIVGPEVKRLTTKPRKRGDLWRSESSLRRLQRAHPSFDLGIPLALLDTLPQLLVLFAIHVDVIDGLQGLDIRPTGLLRIEYVTGRRPLEFAIGTWSLLCGCW